MWLEAAFSHIPPLLFGVSGVVLTHAVGGIRILSLHGVKIGHDKINYMKGTLR